MLFYYFIPLLTDFENKEDVYQFNHIYAFLLLNNKFKRITNSIATKRLIRYYHIMCVKTKLNVNYNQGSQRLTVPCVLGFRRGWPNCATMQNGASFRRMNPLHAYAYPIQNNLATSEIFIIINRSRV